MKSYESSKWHIRLYRKRWYLYAIFLFIVETFKLSILVDYFLEKELDEKTTETIKSDWKEIKKHVELTKMNKYS